MKRSDGELIRLAHSLARMRTAIDSIAIDVECGRGPTLESAQTVTMTANEIAMQIAKFDAYRHAEEDTTAAGGGRG